VEIGVQVFGPRLHSYSKQFDSCSGYCFDKNLELLLFDSCSASSSGLLILITKALIYSWIWTPAPTLVFQKKKEKYRESGRNHSDSEKKNAKLRLRLHSCSGCWSPLVWKEFLLFRSSSEKMLCFEVRLLLYVPTPLHWNLNVSYSKPRAHITG